MPVYMSNSPKGTISSAAKAKIAADVTRIHCDVTGAPPEFVHVFFLEDAPSPPLNGNSAFLLGSIRSGRTDAQKQQIASEMAASISSHTGLPLTTVGVTTRDTPASWVLEGGEIMPEPGEEAVWMERLNAKRMAEAN
ncbi:MAG: tautomerase family protein [Pseudomonadota bacterium]